MHDNVLNNIHSARIFLVDINSVITFNILLMTSWLETSF